MKLDPDLLAILACPCERHEPVVPGSTADALAEVLSCTGCGKRFTVTDGIPVMLLDEALPPVPGPLPTAGRSTRP